jgi:demethylmenaquinone methyltransferase/2-methoxy-6-polyprenyl-1,4-benzoquinol methylase
VTDPAPAFATDAATARYYDQRADEFDEWYAGGGQFVTRDRPGWDDEMAEVVDLIRGLPSARTLDVACGTGFLTRHLSGFVVGLDQSTSMVSIAQSRLPNGLAVVGDALHLLVADGSFDRVMTGHFFGHLPPEERAMFLAEARRVARELIVIDSAFRDDVAAESWTDRILNDGSHYRVYKRYLTGTQLAHEIGGEVLMDGHWFVAARASLH